MKEYIERAKAINAIRQYQYPYGVEFLLANIPAADVVEVNAHDRMTVEIPCRIGDPVWIIRNRGGNTSPRPTRVARIEIDDKLRPVIYTKGGFGLWGEKIFPDATSAAKELERRKHE